MRLLFICLPIFFLVIVPARAADSQAVEAREHVKELQAERRAAQVKLNKAAETMYAQAMRLYKRGFFAEAEAKFKDIEDTLPGYKQTRDHIRKAHIAARTEKSRPKPEPAVPPMPQESRDETVQKALDAAAQASTP